MVLTNTHAYLKLFHILVANMYILIFKLSYLHVRLDLGIDVIFIKINTSCTNSHKFAINSPKHKIVLIVFSWNQVGFKTES